MFTIICLVGLAAALCYVAWRSLRDASGTVEDILREEVGDGDE